MAERSPLHEVTEQAGAACAEWDGWLMPAHFGDVLTEYQAALDQAVVFDLSHRTKIELTGTDRAGFLHSFCTNDIQKLQPGEGCEAFITTAQARIIARVLVYVLKDSIRLDAEPGLSGKIIAHLDRYLITEDVVLSDRTREFAQLHVLGPRSEQVLGTLDGDCGLRIADCGLDRGSSSIPNPQSAIGNGCQVRRNDALGQAGYDLLCPAAQAPQLWQTIVARGGRPAGLEAYEILRLEAGTPEYGRDIDESNLPQEVNRDACAISFTKGCYLGQETVCRIRDMGHVNRLLVGLQLSSPLKNAVAGVCDPGFIEQEPASERPATVFQRAVSGQETVPAGVRVLRDGKEVGKITSSVVSPRLGSIALAYVRRECHVPGTQLEVDPGTARHAAHVRSFPSSGP